MKIPAYQPIEGIDELLKIVGNSKLWTERVEQLKTLDEHLSSMVDKSETKKKLNDLIARAEAQNAAADRALTSARKEAEGIVGAAKEKALEVEGGLSDARLEIRITEGALDARAQSLEKRAAELKDEAEGISKRMADIKKREEEAASKRAAAQKLKGEYEEKARKMKEALV